MFKDFSRSADIGCHDRQTIEHAFQDHQAEWFVTARHDENISRRVPERHLRGRLPTGKVYPLQERGVLGFQPLSGYSGGRKWRGPASQHEAGSRHGLQHFGNCREQLAYALSLDQPSAIEHRRHFRTSGERCLQCCVRIFNPVPYHPYLRRRLRIVLPQKNFLRSRQGDQPVGSDDGFFLRASLCEKRVGFIAQVIFGSVDGVHV